MKTPSIGRMEAFQNRDARSFNGQIMKGKVLSFDGKNHAFVELFGRVVRAEIEVPLKAGASYLFEWFKEGEGVRLRMLKEWLPDTSSRLSAIESSIRRLGLPISDKSAQIVELFLKREWPLHAQTVKQAIEWFSEPPSSDEIKSFESLLFKGLPLKTSLFKALTSSSHDKPVDFNLRLAGMLNRMGAASPAIKQLDTLLKTWPTIFQVVERTSGEWLKDILVKMGYFHEANIYTRLENNQPLNLTAFDNLKALLLNVLKSQASHTEEIRGLLQHITGQQLQAISSDHNIIQFLFSFPIRFGHHFKTIDLSWEGRRGPDGEMEKDFCKVVCRLDLSRWKETVLHILVQKRIVTLTIFNDHPELKRVIDRYRPVLEQRLNDLGYQVATVKQEIGAMETAHAALFRRTTGDMDVKV